MTSPAARGQAVRLDDRYDADAGVVLMSGIQALVRLMLDQRRLDTARGLNTGLFVSGYQGSPLGGLDRELARIQERLDAHGIVFKPGLNEELAATAVGGTQLLGELDGRRHDGVVGFWYGKNPGLDRAADAIRHANMGGTAPLGGAVAFIGDDPGCKSSTLPSACEPLCRSLVMPVLAPSSVEELLTFGLHAVALSRAAGTWVGLKVVADIADASATVLLDGMLDRIPTPSARDFTPPTLLPPTSMLAERDLFDARLARVHAYARANGFTRVTHDSARPRLAVVAAGATHAALVRALQELELDECSDAVGLRVIQLAMPWPLQHDDLAPLLRGVDEVLVLEDKLAFVEPQLKELLYRDPRAPLIVGKQDEHGRPLVPAAGTLEPDAIARLVASRIAPEALPPAARERLAVIERRGAAVAELPQLAARTPYFCSGCPHNASTQAEDDQLVGPGIGCHAMVALDSGGRGKLIGTPQMGGEGAQWFGLEPFTDDEHFTQNLGDGTFFHSGSLAIRAAVAAKAHITFKLLYNDAVAMTGGQAPEGQMGVPELTRLLALEGVERIVVTTPEPDGYRGATLDPIASVRHRDELPAAEADLRATSGVTVLIHDDRCATEERRMRKRGQLPTPPDHVWINERVCEGCGDCGHKSTCLSVVPVATEFGRKTEIHQSSCNQDRSCLKGDCPSFAVVVPKKGAKTKKVPPPLPVELSDPVLRVPADDVLVRMPGVGGTGVVTVSQILQMAAHIDGRHAAGLDQTGLAQKGGPVISDVHIAATPITGALRATDGAVDLLLGFDVLGASTPATLAVADPRRTVAVVDTTAAPTAAMVTNVSIQAPSTRKLLARIDAATRAGERCAVDAHGLAERLFGDHLPANLLLVGAAFQHGCLPLSAGAIEQAIALNGAAAETNVAAFRWGRAVVADPDAVEAAIAAAATDAVAAKPSRAERRAKVRAAAIVDATGAQGELRRLLEIRVEELIGYQGAKLAQSYADEVMGIAGIERDRAHSARGAAPVAAAYARGLHKLLAYKDEYEVARLHLATAERARINAELGPGARVGILLQPPLLRALGIDRKLRFGRWFRPALRVLRAGKRVRGTPLDLFARTEVRRVERALPDEYRALVDRSLAELTPANVAAVAEIAGLPDLVRGYEEIKLANVVEFRRRGDRLVASLIEDGEQDVVDVQSPLRITRRGPAPDRARSARAAARRG